MKELATLALVILPLGMTIVEILAADGSTPVPEQHNGGGEVHREATAVPTAEITGTRPRRNRPPHAPGALDGDAVSGKPA